MGFRAGGGGAQLAWGRQSGLAEQAFRAPRFGQCHDAGARASGEFESKRGTTAWSAFDGDIPPHHLTELFGERKTETRSAIFARGGVIDLRKRTEEFAHLLGRHANAGVGDAKEEPI